MDKNINLTIRELFACELQGVSEQNLVDLIRIAQDRIVLNVIEKVIFEMEEGQKEKIPVDSKLILRVLQKKRYSPIVDWLFTSRIQQIIEDSVGFRPYLYQLAANIKHALAEKEF